MDTHLVRNQLLYYDAGTYLPMINPHLSLHGHQVALHEMQIHRLERTQLQKYKGIEVAYIC
jgi:hypothetical protein